MTGLKNISKAEVLTLKDEVAYQKGQVVSKTLAQNAALSVTLFSFDKGEEISTHESGGDAFVTCLDGMGRITIDGKEYLLREGESIIMPGVKIGDGAIIAAYSVVVKDGSLLPQACSVGSVVAVPSWSGPLSWQWNSADSVVLTTEQPTPTGLFGVSSRCSLAGLG